MGVCDREVQLRTLQGSTAALQKLLMDIWELLCTQSWLEQRQLDVAWQVKALPV